MLRRVLAGISLAAEFMSMSTGDWLAFLLPSDAGQLFCPPSDSAVIIILSSASRGSILT